MALTAEQRYNQMVQQANASPYGGGLGQYQGVPFAPPPRPEPNVKYPQIDIQPARNGYVIRVTTAIGKAPDLYVAEDITSLQEVVALALVNDKLEKAL